MSGDCTISQNPGRRRVVWGLHCSLPIIFTTHHLPCPPSSPSLMPRFPSPPRPLLPTVFAACCHLPCLPTMFSARCHLPPSAMFLRLPCSLLAAIFLCLPCSSACSVSPSPCCPPRLCTGPGPYRGSSSALHFASCYLPAPSQATSC